MSRFARYLTLWSDDRGTTAIEYALIASLIAVVILGAAQSIGNSLVGTFNNVANGL
jgi:pilus assembly protein Flp/PilA